MLSDTETMFNYVPRWLLRLTGRALVKGCPRKIVICEECHLRALCKCAHDDFVAGVGTENKVWNVICICALAAIVYVVMASLF